MATPSSSSSSAAAAGPSSSTLPPVPRATSVLVIGMAGSGKSTFAGALSDYVSQQAAQQQPAAAAEVTEETPQSSPAYIVNLDPAVNSLNYEPSVDIRDTIDYKRVMEEYNLGPNGGILTSLNLFTTKFDQVLGILERRAAEVDQIILDTPGQIEIFTWSASGTIITDSLASAMPTCVAYVVDTPKTTAPATFMSNMLYACSIMYKTKLPLILVFNKIDMQTHDFALEWMSDFETFQAALQKGNATDNVDVAGNLSGARKSTGDGSGSGSYMNSLMNSMALVLDEFYNNIRAVGVSSTTHEGMSDVLSTISAARQEYLTEYRPELERLRQSRVEKENARKKEEVRRMMKDLRVGGKGGNPAGGSGGSRAEDEDKEDPRVTAMMRGEEDYDGNGTLLDPDEEEYMGQGAAQGQAGQPVRRGPGATGGISIDDGTQWPPAA
ncbi:hypothetical protein BCV69DRAFT_285179 [Microstroma glucosiphilum]|uniref:GPN-loop GTPase n=1 Tax=Pseudomicrostroma glucosiphilum TaxID=1684307 RepID=A0A316TYG9_9BASI|nr:hypothetical protein BCV69DRAFT_285179 [Pseudomicrostroma glucosiphilum]PWN18197.1 hypothetical protein BCV69DRAFT_285179 [Pseudomicrostroma glucosiphilum]